MVRQGQVWGGSLSSPLTGNSNQMVDDINNAKILGTRKKLHTSVTIPVAKPFKGNIPLEKRVTADLECLIKKGKNIPYMAAWYNGRKMKVQDISLFGFNTNEMLSKFWLDLINNNRGCTVYFHNWAGYANCVRLSDAVVDVVTSRAPPWPASPAPVVQQDAPFDEP